MFSFFYKYAIICLRVIKMAKKNNKKAKKINSKQIREENEMIKFIKMIIVVTIIFGAFYALTIFINKDEEKNKGNEGTEVKIQYDEILIGNIFSQKPDNYYVLIEDTDDKNVQVYEMYFNQYKSKKDAIRVYTAILNNMFNSKFKNDEAVYSDSIDELKVTGTTLLEIENGSIKKYYDTDESIRNVLKEITKTEEA